MQRERSSDPLLAESTDAKLGVHCLSEFAFCPRAGLCLHEQDDEYTEVERQPRLDYLPIYEQAELERTLKGLLQQFWGVLFGGSLATVLCVTLAWLTGWLLAWVAAAAIGGLTVVVLVDRAYHAFVAYEYLKIWRDAEPELPDPDSTKTQDIHWCKLLAVPGLTLVIPPEPYTHPPWRLGGTPWRLLRYGDLWIPVFLHRTAWSGLREQHFVRMVAYCRLLEACVGFKSPYGVVVQVGTFAAVTVPNSPTTREALQEALGEARKVIRAAEEMNRFPPVPAGGAFCVGCHVGKPRVYRRGQEFTRHGTPIPVDIAPGPGGKDCHSHCGDRFAWVPPHGDMLALGTGRTDQR